MKLACVREIAELAKADISEEVATAYAGQELAFGPDYIIPKPFDSRLILRIAPAVAKAAEASGVATRPIADFEAYRQHADALRLPDRHVHAAGVRRRQGRDAKRVAYAEGEDERVLRAAQTGGRRRPGQADPDRPPGGDRGAHREGRACACSLGTDVECVNPETIRASAVLGDLPPLMGRRGITPEAAKAAVRRSNTTIGALMLHLGDADAMLCGLVGRFDSHLEHMQRCDRPARAARRASRRSTR